MIVQIRVRPDCEVVINGQQYLGGDVVFVDAIQARDLIQAKKAYVIESWEGNQVSPLIERREKE